MRLLLLIILCGYIAWMLKDTPLADQLKEKAMVQLEAIQRQMIEVATQKVTEMASAHQGQQQAYFAANDLIQHSENGVLTIPKGSLIHIVEMSGDQIIVTNGITKVTTTPDGITNVAPQASLGNPSPFPSVNPSPAMPGSAPSNNRIPYPDAPATSVNPLEPKDTDTPEQLRLKQRISEIDQKIAQLDLFIYSSRYSRNQIPVVRARREIEHLNLQRENLVRSLR